MLNLLWVQHISCQEKLCVATQSFVDSVSCFALIKFRQIFFSCLEDLSETFLSRTVVHICGCTEMGDCWGKSLKRKLFCEWVRKFSSGNRVFVQTLRSPSVVRPAARWAWRGIAVTRRAAATPRGPSPASSPAERRCGCSNTTPGNPTRWRPGRTPRGRRRWAACSGR